MAEPLVTARELALWTSSDPDEVQSDPFALEVMDKVSDMIRHLGGHPDWTLEPGEDQAPFDVRMVVLGVAKRCYENPKQVKAEGSVGPIGGDTVLDVAAILWELTDAERAKVVRHNPDGDPDFVPQTLFTLSTAYDGPLGASNEIYMSDDQQVNMHPGQSAWPSWDIPVFTEQDGAMVEGAGD